MKSQRKSTALWVIIPIFILLFLLFNGCHSLTNSTSKTDASADYQLKHFGGMTYLIVTAPTGINIANITKDSLEVCVRRRNELYIELTNRQLQKK